MNNDSLEEIVRNEAELAEALLGLVKQQQNAIVHFQDAALTSILEQQQQLLRPLEALELERVRMMRSVDSRDDVHAPASTERLRTLVREIGELNRQNKTLLESSLKFIHQNIRIVTEDFSRQLVDARI